MPVGPLQIVDLGATGFGAEITPDLTLPPGSVLEEFDILLEGRQIWSGEAVVVHGHADRIGARFTSGVLDLAHLKLGATIDNRVRVLSAQKHRLAPSWRAAVGDVRQLLEEARLEVEAFERAVPADPLYRAEEEATLFAGLQAGWGTAYFAALADLQEESKTLDPADVPLAQSYASLALMPLLAACPMHRRAYEKPLGYAGDYHMMELYFTRDFRGDGLFGRFLHSVGQQYSLGRTVVAREVVMRQAVRAAIRAPGEDPVRILSVAAGPAIELRKVLAELTSLERPLDLILLDQDEAAHETAHRRLTRLLVEHHKGRLPVRLECLHFSVRQLLKPQTLEEAAVAEKVLGHLDLAYSAGLYDYLTDSVAARLTHLLYSRLRPGGRLLVGNLMETPDTTWLMEYVLGWHLVYRTEPDMLRFAEGLAPAPASVGVTRDATGRCLFLDVTSPS
jgi:extracellular factor (EF) 3-hydroxypalmitic acid methyl ester biosynthesis protein